MVTLDKGMNISILKIIEDTTVDGPGLRTAIYAAGCPNACPGCHNKASWDIEAGHPMTVEQIMKTVRADEFADVTFSGGDPLFQPEGFAALAGAIKQETHKNIWCYTGFLFEQLLQNPIQIELLQRIDVLVDGPFLEEYKDISLPFRGSSNQRLIDVPASLAAHRVVLFSLMELDVAPDRNIQPLFFDV